MALILWDRIHSQKDTLSDETERSSFVINREVINLNQVIQNIIDLFQNNFEREFVVVFFDPSQDLHTVNSDRIILRQIIIRIFNLLLQKTDCRHIQLGLEQKGEDVNLLLTCQNHHSK